jgi:hypothetical protein
MDEAIKILAHVRNLIVAGLVLAVAFVAYTELSDGPSSSDCAIERHEAIMGRGDVSPACR